MNFREFERKYSDYPLFSLCDIEKANPEFDRRRLVEWQKKNYIKRLSNAWYTFEGQNIDEAFLYLCSNKIYQPSYVSLESALSFHGFIPEGVFNITGVSTKKTKEFTADSIRFCYRKLKNDLLWGSQLQPVLNTYFKIASPEKAILDYFYLNKKIKKTSDIEGLRLNYPLIKESISLKTLEKYTHHFDNNRVNQLINSLLKEIKNA